jgi:hypothetical protein
VAGAVDLLESVRAEGEAHEHLMGECPWYRKVSEGAGAADHAQHCEPATGKGAAPRLVVKMTPRTAEASTVPKPTVPPGGPGLFHVKGLELPPYIQHLWFHLVKRYGKHDAYGVAVGIVKKWAQGVNPGGWKTKSGKGKRTHPDVRAAAQRNVEQWEADRARAHSSHSAGDHDSPEVLPLAAQNMGTATAPGARPLPPAPTGGTYSQYGLNQRPSQTISPSPPLPPRVPMPTPDECRRLAAQVPDSADATLSSTARVFLTQAAGKLERHDHLQALAILRSAETALAAAHRADISVTMPSQYTANVFTRIPPAEQSSASSAVLQTRAQTLRWRALEQQTAALTDRIRRRFFHGTINGPSQLARFSQEGEMSAVDKVLALAGPAAHDVSEQVHSDTSGETPLLQVPENLDAIMDTDARRKFDALPAIDRLRITRYMDAAKAVRPSSPAIAAQHLARAKVIAREAGAHDLARHLHQHIEALTLGSNRTVTRDEAAEEPRGVRNSPDKPYGSVTTLRARVR